MSQENGRVGLKDISSRRNPQKTKGINFAKILRNWRRDEETALTGNEEVDQIVEALKGKAEGGFDFIVRNGADKEIYRFYFLGPGRAAVSLGSKWGQTLVTQPCPICGISSPVMVLVPAETDLPFKRRKKEATIHCGELQIFK